MPKLRKIITYPLLITSSGGITRIEKELPTEVKIVKAVAIHANRMDLAHYRGQCSLQLSQHMVINDGEDAKDYETPFEFGEIEIATTDRRIRFAYQDVPADGTTFPAGGYTVKLKLYYTL